MSWVIIRVFFLLLFQASLRIFCPTFWMVVCSRTVGVYTANDCPQIKTLEIMRTRIFFIKKSEESKSALDVLISPYRCKKNVGKLLFLFFHWLFFILYVISYLHKTLMITYYPASERGKTQIWRLESYHSFSFGEYYDPQKMYFWPLRVINDDSIEGGNGFPPHPHRDMEIISIPLEGWLMHEDSMGTKTIISPQMIQVMSAGTGLHHAEYNAYPDVKTKFLQIWIEPQKRGVEPRHEEKSFPQIFDTFQLLISPDARQKSIMIHQDAYISRLRTDKIENFTYTFQGTSKRIYAFVIEWTVQIWDQTLRKRDALSMTDVEDLIINMKEKSDLLIFEI